MRSLALTLCLVAVANPALAQGAAPRHAAWRTCLVDAFALRAALAVPARAADAAFEVCRAREADYLAALSALPLLDADDVGRARPALLARARAWLIAGRSL